jgi:hypothetical protein
MDMRRGREESPAIVKDTLGSTLQVGYRSSNLLRRHLLPGLFDFIANRRWILHFFVDLSGDVAIDGFVLVSRQTTGFPVGVEHASDDVANVLFYFDGKRASGRRNIW